MATEAAGARCESIERIHGSIGTEEFFDRFVWPGRPAILQGICETWDRERRWTLNALNGALGEKLVRVTVSEGVYDFDRRKNYWKPKELNVRMPFSQLVDHIVARRNNGPCLYLHQTPIPDQLPELSASVGSSNLMPPGSLLAQNVWVGSSGNVSSLHFDQPNNFLMQMDGRKRFILFDPWQWKYLYASPRIPHFSQVDIERPNLEAFPDFRHARPMEVTVEAGETLYLPPFWWHQVYSETASVSVNLFWKSYTHQFLVPAMFRTIPALHARIHAKYYEYLPGRLPRIVDFVNHALGSGLGAVAVVFGCALLIEQLEAAAKSTLGESVCTVSNYADARHLAEKLNAAGRIGHDAFLKIVDWLGNGQRALELVALSEESENVSVTAYEIVTAWESGQISFYS